MANPLADFTAQDALVAIMIAASASDEQVVAVELVTIERIVNSLPAFRGYDHTRLSHVSQTVLDLFTQENGLDLLFDVVRNTLPPRLYETAYALACDVAASDGKLPEQELRWLEEMRYELNIERLHAAAIERGSRARHQSL